MQTTQVHEVLSIFHFFFFLILKFFTNKNSYKIADRNFVVSIYFLLVACAPSIHQKTSNQLIYYFDVVKQIRYEINYMIITLQLPESRISSSYYHRLLLYLFFIFFIFLCLSVYKYYFLIPSFYWFFNAIHVSLSRICVELMRMRKMKREKKKFVN